MKSEEAGFRKLSPAVDRIFRFAEMIGVTALLSVVLPSVRIPLTFIGSEMALYYLLEPSIDAFTYWLVPEVNTRQDRLRILVVSGVLIFGVYVATGPVSRLTEVLSRTVNTPAASVPIHSR